VQGDVYTRITTRLTPALIESMDELLQVPLGIRSVGRFAEDESVALVGWMQAMGLAPNHVAWVPSNGAAPAMQDLAAGGLDLTTCSVPEARAIIEAGKARSLALMASARNPAFPDVPTLKEAMGIDYSTGAWRGIAGPKGLPADVATKLTASLKKVFDSKEFKEFMSNRGFGTVWGDAAQFETFMDKGDAQMGVAMKAAGLSKA
jgi:tripartite-type tricarboxylate transporter receptor subunit TctC